MVIREKVQNLVMITKHMEEALGEDTLLLEAMVVLEVVAEVIAPPPP